jgi:two-component system OmpR family response regulator
VNTEHVRVLLIEDQPKMASLLRVGLRDEGLLADVATNGEEGLWAATENDYDVIVLDVMLPDINGFDVCRRMRAATVAAPILLLTARGAVADRVTGLDAGADDYLVKPFAFDELVARLRALLRRGPVTPAVLVVGDLRLDPGARRVWRGDDEVTLTGQEFSLLHTLARRPGRVLTREQLLHLAWDMAYEQHSNVVDVCVKGLRDSVDRPFQRHSIQTVRGVGYRLSEDFQ